MSINPLQITAWARLRPRSRPTTRARRLTPPPGSSTASPHFWLNSKSARAKKVTRKTPISVLSVPRHGRRASARNPARKARHLQVARALFRLPRIIFELHLEPRFSGAADCLFQLYGHFRRHAGMAVRGSDSALRVTPRPFAEPVTVRPSGSRHSSLMISPRCGGSCILGMVSHLPACGQR